MGDKSQKGFVVEDNLKALIGISKDCLILIVLGVLLALLGALL